MWYTLIVSFQLRTQSRYYADNIRLRLATSEEIVAENLAASTASSDTLRQMRSWVSNCLNTHTDCQISKRLETLNHLPTRLIHLAIDQNSDDVQAILCDSKTLCANTTYVTLSHSWGSEPFLTLNRTNIAQFRRGIPVSSLSRCFQDAIRTTYRLGYKFLWIDSLCIIQDSAKDWVRESKRMAEVYELAVCNLSASAFSSGTHGFLTPFRNQNPISPRIELGGVIPGTYFLVDPDIRNEICEGFLFQRGWVLQEQILVSSPFRWSKATDANII